ncbi:MAG: DNA recombination protein RmuC [Rubrivivax sp.]|jgi:DNA recombination protein RmuC|nr:DNA recombination protein RmuC [Rubrivivax sp.]
MPPEASGVSMAGLLLAAAVAAALGLLVWWWLRAQQRAEHDGQAAAQQLRNAQALFEQGLLNALDRHAQSQRADLSNFQRMLLTQSGDVARTQNEQIDSFRTQLAQTQQAMESSLRRANELLVDQLQRLQEAQERRHADMRQGVEQRLTALQEGNEKKLDQMRAMVDEKLHATLEQRLGESFKLVADRLDQVHKGLGDMQNLARDVGSLNRVLTNVKTRGVFGEVQLAALLEQVFTPEQYAANVETVPGSGARVEFALRLPGRGDSAQPLWLPIDAKFPREDHERLLDAQERADAPAAEAAARAIETRLRLEARTIREKYIAAPYTTDFAILFVPTESLYAELLRRPGLSESLQREHHIVLAGPTTLLATLSSLQMGFRTLALEKRSAEVWQVLGAVKTEFLKFGEVMDKTRRKLQEASNTIESAQTRTRAMERTLRQVEAMPQAATPPWLPLAAEPPAEEDLRG